LSKTTSSASGAELLVRSLIRLGVQDAFQIAGLGLLPLAEAFHRHDDEIRYISALNETNLALIAGGYARAKRQAAFVNVYHASGTALAMMAVTTAWAEGVPLVFTTTTSSRKLTGRDQYAAVPSAVTEMTSQFVKWSIEVPSADRIPEIVERAFQIANTPPFGPVHLAFPMDLWLEETIDPGPLPESESHVDFQASDAGVRRIAELAAESELPLIVVGSEVSRYGGVEQAIRLAEIIGAPVVSEDKISDLGFPTSHRQFVGNLSGNRDLVDNSDFALLLGVELTESGLTAPVDFGNATTVLLSADPLMLRRQLRPTLAVLGMPAPTLRSVADILERCDLDVESRARRLSLVSELQLSRRKRHARIRAVRFDETPLAIGRIITEIEATMPANVVVVNHCASGEPFFEDLLKIDDTDSYFGISAKASAQGWGGPAAIGIQLARPHTRVLAVLGDGGFMFSSTAIHTAAQFRIPVIFVVLNNGGWRDIAALARVSGSPLAEAEDSFGWRFDPAIDHTGFARSLGLAAERVTTPDALRAALKVAFGSEAPTLIEVDNAPEDADEFSRLFLQA
jgi:thiamine pyrophosphate-dependent acetolactate synthase large subunit-like protein